MKWKILKGSEKDFEGAPEWAMQVVVGNDGNIGFETNILGNQKEGDLIWWRDEVEEDEAWRLQSGEVNGTYGLTIVAQRRPITEIDVNQQLTTEWSGEGLPPVGVECEMLWNKEWIKCVIKFYGDEQFIFKAQGHKEWAGHINNFEFRPIRSAEDVARHNALYALESLNIDSDVTVSIYDAIAAGKIP